jgi:serine/threonine-protein kinase RsbW
MIPQPVSLEIEADGRGLGMLDDWIEDVTAGWSPLGVMKARVCAAELAANLLEHGSEPERPARLTLRLSPRPDGVLLEMTDDGRAFDPTAPLSEPVTDDLTTATLGGRGLRAVQAMALALDYQREGGLNRLTVHLPYG